MFPFTDLSSVKQRPALIVSSDARNAKQQDVVLVAITSQLPFAPNEDEFTVPPGELIQWGLPKPSLVKLSKIFCLHQSLVRRTLGTLPP